MNTKQIHLSKIIKIGSIIVPLPVHAKQPGLDGRVFAYGYGGTPSVHISSSKTLYFEDEVVKMKVSSSNSLLFADEMIGDSLESTLICLIFETSPKKDGNHKE